MTHETVTVPDVEIMRVGRWNGVTFTRDDLEGIVAAWRETREVLPPRLQLGHDPKQRYARALFGEDFEGADGFPALGWPTRLRVAGDSLLADFAKVPVALADLIRSGAYRARSGGFLRKAKIGDRAFEWVLDHVALLGDQRPAVPGMAEMRLSAGDFDELVIFDLDAFAGDEVDVDEELDAIEAALEMLRERVNGLTRNRKGNPIIMARFRALREEIQRTARQRRADLSHEGDDAMPNDDSPQADEAPETIETPEATETFADPAAPEAPTEAAPAQGGGVSISSPEVLAAMLAARLGVGPEDYGAIYGAVQKLMDEAGAPEMPEEGDLGLAAEGDVVTLASATFEALRARVKTFEAELAESKAQVARLETERAQERAERRADDDITARSLPAAIRPLLVDLALAGKDELYLAAIESAKAVPSTEAGTSAGSPAAPALSDAELEAARLLKLDPETFAKGR